jgi:DNA-binding transcriptional LysR family regulator
MHPTTRYAKSGDIHVAYQVFGEGPDLIMAPGFVSHIENYWDEPRLARLLSKLGSFCRVVLFDKRGTGLSDRVADLPAMDERMDVTRARPRNHPPSRRSDCRGHPAWVRQERLIADRFCRVDGFLPSLIKAFRARHPDVELTLSAMNNAGLKEALIRREIDGAIARPAVEDDEIISEKLHEEPLIIALPDAFEREWHQPLPLASLRDASFILYPQHPRPSFADHILSVCNAAGFRPHNPVMAMDYQTAVSLVSVDVGVCIVPRSVSATQHAGVIYRDFLGPNPGTSLSVNYRIDNRSPQLLGFLSVAREYARTLKPAAVRLATDRSASPAAVSAPNRLVGSIP